MPRGFRNPHSASAVRELDQPVIVTRVAPPTRVRPERVRELERITGRRVVIGTMWSRDPAEIIEEARLHGAAVIVLDAPGENAAEIARRAQQQGAAVVVAAVFEDRAEEHGRGRVTLFHGYARVNECGGLERLGDAELRREIERREG